MMVHKVLFKMLRARISHLLFFGENGAAQRLELSTFSCMPRKWGKGKAQLREEIISMFNP